MEILWPTIRLGAIVFVPLFLLSDTHFMEMYRIIWLLLDGLEEWIFHHVHSVLLNLLYGTYKCDAVIASARSGTLDFKWACKFDFVCKIEGFGFHRDCPMDSIQLLRIKVKVSNDGVKKVMVVQSLIHSWLQWTNRLFWQEAPVSCICSCGPDCVV